MRSATPSRLDNVLLAGSLVNAGRHEVLRRVDATESCYRFIATKQLRQERVMPIPNTITRTLDLPHPQEKVWAALTTSTA